MATIKRNPPLADGRFDVEVQLSDGGSIISTSCISWTDLVEQFDGLVARTERDVEQAAERLAVAKDARDTVAAYVDRQ